MLSVGASLLANPPSTEAVGKFVREQARSYSLRPVLLRIAHVGAEQNLPNKT